MEEEEEVPPKFVTHILIPQVTVVVVLCKLVNALMEDGMEDMANKEVMMELLVISATEMEAMVIIMEEDMCRRMLTETLVITEDEEAVAISLAVKMFMHMKALLLDIVVKDTIMADVMELHKLIQFWLENCILLTMAMKQMNKVTNSMIMVLNLPLRNRNIKEICISRMKEMHGVTMAMMSMSGHKKKLFRMTVMRGLKKMSHSCFRVLTYEAAGDTKGTNGKQEVKGTFDVL